MRHLYRCPLRWADMDQLGHINNVLYVDYLQEARVDMLRVNASQQRNPESSDGMVVARHEISFLRPIPYGFEPINIECWVSELRAASFTMAYELYADTPAGRVVYARAQTLLTPFVFAEERPRRLTAEEREVLTRFLEPGEPCRRAPARSVTYPESGRCPIQVRFSDVDIYGHVNNVKYFEYYQEGRIHLIRDLLAAASQQSGHISTVVAHYDVDYLQPILARPEPYDVWSRVASVGRTSFVIECEIRDGDRALSRGRAVMVCFDPTTQRASEPPAALRAALLAAQ